MNKFLEQLRASFPILYKKYEGPTCFNMFGIECGEGWNQLIWELSEKIENHIKTQSKDFQNSICVHQIKEKFGELRFYLSCEDDVISNFISEYTNRSMETCEICGESGELREHYRWLQTLCD